MVRLLYNDDSIISLYDDFEKVLAILRLRILYLLGIAFKSTFNKNSFCIYAIASLHVENFSKFALHLKQNNYFFFLILVCTTEIKSLFI